MARKRVTIKDIAQQLQVSPATVSLALSESPLTSRQTRLRVQQTARELGYRPNLMARSLVKNRTHLVGTLVPDISTSFFPEVLQGIEDVIGEMDYINVLTISYYRRDLEIRHLQSLLEKDIEGLLIVPSFEHDNDPLPRLLKETHLPIVSLITVDPRIESNYVKVDHYQGAIEAMQYLIRQGHERIGFIRNENPDCRRYEGYLKALRDHGIDFDPAYCAGNGYSWESGYEGALQLLQLPQPPTAIFATSDLAAMGVLAAARQRGVPVPGQLSVVGYDDLSILQQLHFNLTTVSQPKKIIGEYAARALFDRIEGKPVENVLITPKLIVRGTSGPNPEKQSIPGSLNFTEWP
jgi:LacI family transcriptional regulator